MDNNIDNKENKIGETEEKNKPRLGKKIDFKKIRPGKFKLRDPKLVLALFFLVVGILFLIFKPGKFSGLSLPGKNIEKVNVLKMEDSIENLEGTKFGMYKNYLYKWQNGKIFLRSLTEEGLSYNMALNMYDPIIVPGNKYIFLGNPEDGIIYFLNSKAEMVERIPLNSPLFSMREEADNLIYHTKKDGSEAIGIIDSSFNNTMKYAYDGESILTYDYFPSKEKVAIAVLNIDEKSLGTRLDLYSNLRDKESLYFDGEIVLDLKYINLGNLLVLTDNNLYYISENEIAWKRDFPLIKNMEVEGNNIYVLNGNHLTILDNKGETKEDLTFTEQYTGIKLFERGLFKDELILYNENGLVLVKNGEVFLDHKQEVLQVDVNQDTIFLLDNDKYGFYKKTVKELEVEEE